MIKLIFDKENWLWKSTFGDIGWLMIKWLQVESQKYPAT